MESKKLNKIADGLARRNEAERVKGLSQAIEACSTDDCDCCEYKDNTVERCSACEVAFVDHDGLQKTCSRLQAAESILQKLYDEFCPSDSYGVHGSEFQTCMRCHTGGSPTRPWKHADDCEIKKIEDYLFGE